MTTHSYEIVVGNMGRVWSKEISDTFEPRVARQYNDWITESKRPSAARRARASRYSRTAKFTRSTTQMDLFEFLGKLDESGASYHWEGEQDGSALSLKLEVETGGFFARYVIELRLISAGTYKVHGLPTGDAEALFEAYTLAEAHGTRVRGGEDYTFSLDDLVDLIAEAR